MYTYVRIAAVILVAAVLVVVGFQMVRSPSTDNSDVGELQQSRVESLLNTPMVVGFTAILVLLLVISVSRALFVFSCPPVFTRCPRCYGDNYVHSLPVAYLFRKHACFECDREFRLITSPLLRALRRRYPVQKSK